MDFILTPFVLLSKCMTFGTWSINFYWILTWDRNFLRLFLFCNRIPDPGWSSTPCSRTWPWTSEPPNSNSWVLRLQAWATNLSVWGTGDWSQTSSMQSKHSTKGTTLLGPHFEILHSNMSSSIFISPDSDNFSCYS